jgi:hypothetical protein
MATRVVTRITIGNKKGAGGGKATFQLAMGRRVAPPFLLETAA